MMAGGDLRQRPQPTERFERVLALASDEADGLGHGFVGCQHLLYALARESRGLASAVLTTLGATPSVLHGYLSESAAPHDRVGGSLDLADEVRAALARAADAARDWGHRWLDTEHILFGIVCAHTSADEMLSALRLDPSAILGELARLRQAAPPPAIQDEGAHTYRFTLEGAWVLSLAMDVARRYSAGLVTSLHLLVALISLHTTARNVLVDQMGLSAEALDPYLTSGAAPPGAGRIPLSEEAQHILGYALGEAWNRGHLAVTPLHMAMGLARGERNAALDVLAELGIMQAELEDAIAAVMPPPIVR